MIVVSDTTPLISLLKIDRLDLLEKLFGQVLIPEGVFHELTENESYSDEAEMIRICDFIQIRPVDRSSVYLFQKRTGLDFGESEAIVLTEELGADLTLLDERQARAVASNIGLAIMGTVGILGTALHRGYLTADDLRQYIKIFKENRRHIDENLFRRLLGSDRG